MLDLTYIERKIEWVQEGNGEPSDLVTSNLKPAQKDRKKEDSMTAVQDCDGKVKKVKEKKVGVSLEKNKC